MFVLLLVVNIIMMLVATKWVVFSRFIVELLVNIIVSVYYLVKIIRHLNPINYMKAIGKTILNSMILTNKIVTNKQFISNEIEKFEFNGNKYYKAYLKGATVYENNLFIQSFEEVYNRVIDTRYVICVKRKNKLSKDSYFNVPSILDNDKKEATIFWNEWNSNVCKGKLIYTRSKEGRKLLLKARKSSMSYNENFFVRKEVSKWK